MSRESDIHAIDLLCKQGFTFKDLSLRGGKKETYVQQFYRYGKPQRLSAAFKETLSNNLRLDPVLLLPKRPADIVEGSFKDIGASPAPKMTALPTRVDMPRDVPVLGSGTGGPDGSINMGEPVDYLKRPPALAGAQDVYGVFVVGESMEPRYFAGDPLFVSSTRPIRVGDHVVIQCATPDGDLLAFVKVVTGRKGASWAFAQYNPAGEWLPPGPVHSVHRVYTLADIHIG